MKKNDCENAMNCMTLIVGKNASATGYVLVAHNEDDSGRNVVRHAYVKPADWPEGAFLDAEEGRAKIPQARHTLGYAWTQVRGETRGYSSADLFLNEKGVCVVSNSAGASRETGTDEALLKDGGLEYNLRRIVAERAESAKDGFERMISLVNEWGYASPGRIYTVADANEAYMLQLVRGKRWIGARVPDDAVVVMPNHYTFHGLNDVPGTVFSQDLVGYALQNGWYVPAVPGDFSDFDFASAYQEPRGYRIEENVLRQKFGLETVLKRPWDVKSEGLPFCVRTERKVTLEDAFCFLSAHYDGTAYDLRFGPGMSPHATSVRRICTMSTNEAVVYDLRPEPILTTAWTAFGRPCELPFVPLHPLAGYPAEIDRMEDAAKERANHLKSVPRPVGYRESGWQKTRDFENLLEANYLRCACEFQKQKQRLFERQRAENERLTQSSDLSKGVWENANRAFAREALALTEAFSARYFSSSRITDFPVLSLSSHAPVCVAFVCPGEPDEASLSLVMGGMNARTEAVFARKGSLKAAENGQYTAIFPSPLDAAPVAHADRYDFILGGRNQSGEPFGAMTVASVEP